MSRLAPDLPELQGVPEAARSLVYVRAFNAAIRSPLTWLTGAIVLALAVVLGATQGRALLGGPGAALGAAVGAAAAIRGFFTLILPWRARRLLPAASGRSGEMIDELQHATGRVKRMVDAYERQEPGSSDKARDPRDPARLP